MAHAVNGARIDYFVLLGSAKFLRELHVAAQVGLGDRALHDDPLSGSCGEVFAGAHRLAVSALDAAVDFFLDSRGRLEVAEVQVGICGQDRVRVEDAGRVEGQVLGTMGLGPFPWLNSTATAMPSIVLEVIWATAGGTAIIYLAAITSVKPELYEAAEIDGSSIWRRIWHVTLPQLRGVILALILLQLIGTLQVFTEPFVFTGGGPDNATITVLMLIYSYAFQYGDYGAATALSFLLALSLAVVSVIYLWSTRKWNK